MSLDIQFSVPHEASSEGNFSLELMWLCCDKLCAIWIKHFLHNICSVSSSFIWDRKSYLAKGCVFEVSFRLSPCLHTYICTYLYPCKSNTKVFISVLSNSFSSAYVIWFHYICTFGKQTPKSLHGQVFAEVQMHAERFLPTKGRYMHTKIHFTSHSCYAELTPHFFPSSLNFSHSRNRYLNPTHTRLSTASTDCH